MLTTSTYQTGIRFDSKESELPHDTIQCIEWDPSGKSTLFVTGSWDGSAKLWDINANSVILKATYSFSDPVLSLAFSKEHIVYAGLASGHIYAININGGQTVCIGQHEAPICLLKWVDEVSALMSLGYDTNLYFWKIEGGGFNRAGQFSLPEKTNVAALCYPYLLVCSIDKFKIFRVDKLNTADFREYKMIPLEKNTKLSACAILSDIKQIVLGSIDGLFAFCAFFDDGTLSNYVPIKQTILAKKVDYMNKTLLHQINAIKIVVVKGVIMAVVAGGDSNLIFYSMESNMEIKKYKTKGPVTAIGITKSSTSYYVAFAVGNDWCEGMQGVNKPSARVDLQVKEMVDHDYKK